MQKVVLKTFEGQGLIGLCAKFQLAQSPFMFFVHKYHIFDKYLTKMFPPGSLGSFSHDLNRFIRLRSKLRKFRSLLFEISEILNAMDP